jgi:putative nucleotidyltransferase with HDIG domain
MVARRLLVFLRQPEVKNLRLEPFYRKVNSLLAAQLMETFKGDVRLEAVVGTLRARLLERIKADALELPLLPQVAMEVLALASNENSDARHLADLLRRDQAMTAHVLRIVNSPLYRSRTPIDSLPQAMSRLGLAKIRQIALVISCKQRVFRVKGFEPEVYKSFRHSLATALYAQEIARVRHSPEEEAFLAGLLHDVGRPVLLQAVADLQMDVRLIDAPAVLAVIAELHARVGGMLGRKWGLPMRVTEAIEHHHDPVVSGASNPLPLLVNLADELASTALDANDGADGADGGPTTHWTLAPLRLTPDALAQVISQKGILMQTLQAVA